MCTVILVDHRNSLFVANRVQALIQGKRSLTTLLEVCCQKVKLLRRCILLSPNLKRVQYG
jgi:hypothetical protein